MNREQKNDYHKDLENYFKINKINDKFSDLYEELIVNLPENPYTFLIKYLKNKNILSKIIFINGNSSIVDKLIENLKISFDINIYDKQNLYKEDFNPKLIKEEFIFIKNFPNDTMDLNLINSKKINYSKIIIIDNDKIINMIKYFNEDMYRFLTVYNNYDYEILFKSVSINISYIQNNIKYFYPQKILIYGGSNELVNEINGFLKLELLDKNQIIKEELKNNNNLSELFESQLRNNKKLDSLKVNNLLINKVQSCKNLGLGYILTNYPNDLEDFNVMENFNYSYNLLLILDLKDQKLVKKLKNKVNNRYIEIDKKNYNIIEILSSIQGKFY